MKKVIESIKYIKISDLLAPFIFLIMIFPSLIFRIINKMRKKNLWLVCESGNTARDNGYHFYKYMKENHKEDYCFYVIDKHAGDYSKVEKYGSIIQFKSLKHWLFYLSAKYNISNHKNGNPNQPFFYLLHVNFGLYKNRVFLQHGITKDDAEWLYYKNTKFRYFICGAKREYDFIKEKFGYPKDYVIYTGFPRFDNLHDNNVNNKQILFMPTWRNWLGRETNSFGEKYEFVDTDFYKNWNSLLSNKKLIKYIEDNNYEICFYPHINMQKYLSNFEQKSKNIKILSANDIDIQDLLKESGYLITDYSSVYMDFAYMKKPILYYQFDYKEYREKQYQDGYFDYQKDGFGPVCETCDELVSNLIKIVENGCDKVYTKRMNEFFETADSNNCKRIYDVLNK